MNYVAVLGFAQECTDHNQLLAQDVGTILAKRGYGVAAGNLTSTFYYAFKAAKAAGGSTYGIIEAALAELETQYCDELKIVDDVDVKHRYIAEYCIGAIVIGGGNGTLSVIDKFLQFNRPVVAIEGSGGIVDNELDDAVLLVANSEGAVSQLLKLVRE